MHGLIGDRSLKSFVGAIRRRLTFTPARRPAGDDGEAAHCKVEERLRQTSAQLQATWDALPDLLFEVDRAGRIYDYRAPHPELLYTTPDQFLGKTMTAVLPGEVADVITMAIARAAQAGKDAGATYELSTPAGRRWFELSLAARGDRQAPAGRFIMLVRDITALKQAEAGLRRHRDEMTALQETTLALAGRRAVPDLLRATLDRAMELLHAGGGALWCYRLARDDLELVVESGLRPGLVGTVLRRGEGLAGRILESGRAMILADYARWEGRLEQFADLRLTAMVGVPVRWAERTLGVLSLIGDTSRTFTPDDVALLQQYSTLAAAALENAQLCETISSIYQQLPIGIAIYDRAGRLIEANRACLNLFGIGDTADVTGPDLFADPTVPDAAKEQLRRGQTAHYQAVFDSEKLGQMGLYRAAKAGQVDLDVLITPFEPSSLELGYLMQVQDITDLKRLAQEAAEIETLRQVDQLRTELLANVSHELRTPLGLIKSSCSSLLATDVAFAEDVRTELLRGIEEEADRLTVLVDNLLNLSRMESGRLCLDRRPADVGRLARATVQTLERDSRFASCRFVLDLPATPLVATADGRGIEQVLRNLLDNATKYSPGGGTITVRGRREDKQVVITVRDEGIGIPEGEREKVFDRFYRVDDERVRAAGGVGLGLAVCKSIVEAHGGRIWVESTAGQGSAFHFVLPAASSVGNRSARGE